MTIKIIKNVLFGLTIVCLILAIAAIGVPKLFGVQFRTVMTGSMTPEIPVGSLVVVVPTKAEDIKVGDDITFVKAGDMVVTHRVVKIDRAKDEYTTWGIANDKNAVDAPSKYKNIIGVVRLHIPVIGKLFSWFSTVHGKIIAVTAIIAAFILSAILEIWVRDRRKAVAGAPVGAEAETGAGATVVAESGGAVGTGGAVVTGGGYISGIAPGSMTGNGNGIIKDKAGNVIQVPFRASEQLQKLLDSFEESNALFEKSKAGGGSV